MVPLTHAGAKGSNDLWSITRYPQFFPEPLQRTFTCLSLMWKWCVLNKQVRQEGARCEPEACRESLILKRSLSWEC